MEPAEAEVEEAVREQQQKELRVLIMFDLFTFCVILCINRIYGCIYQVGIVAGHLRTTVQNCKETWTFIRHVLGWHTVCEEQKYSGPKFIEECHLNLITYLPNETKYVRHGSKGKDIADTLLDKMSQRLELQSCDNSSINSSTSPPPTPSIVDITPVCLKCLKVISCRKIDDLSATLASHWNLSEEESIIKFLMAFLFTFSTSVLLSSSSPSILSNVNAAKLQRWWKTKFCHFFLVSRLLLRACLPLPQK